MRAVAGRRLTARSRRAARARLRQRALRVPRLVVFRSNSHIYSQVIGPDARVVASASTLDPALAPGLGSGGNVAAAAKVGALIAERALGKGVGRVAFDRGGYRYHGRVRALAQAAREGGLKF